MYYNLELDWDPKVIGVKNGVFQLELDVNAYDKFAYAKMEHYFIKNNPTINSEFTESDFKFYFKMLKLSKKTTFMSFAPYLNHCHFLIKSSVLELFNSFNVQDHKSFESVVYDSTKEDLDNSYKLFFLKYQNWNVVDFQNTVFSSGGFGNKPQIEHIFTSENELLKFDGIARVRTLALTRYFDNSLDFFHTRLGGLFVSERLKNALEHNNVTGVTFSNLIKIIIK